LTKNKNSPRESAFRVPPLRFGPAWVTKKTSHIRSGRLLALSQALSVLVLPSLMVQARRVLVPQAQASRVF
jgi:hypothetical protein